MMCGVSSSGTTIGMGHGHTLRGEHVATGIIGGIAAYSLLERERAQSSSKEEWMGLARRRLGDVKHHPPVPECGTVIIP